MHLYIHVPFCARRCSYCDFAIAVRREVPAAEFTAAIGREWAAWQGHEAWAGSERVDTIYFGGGTPSRLPSAAIAGLLDRFRSDRELAAGAEVTLEANPDDVTPPAAGDWLAAGVTRVSLGAQSFDPGVLAWMHRTHTAEQVGRAMETLRTAGIHDVSLDLIYAVPEALGRDWGADLDRALALGPTHLSLYGLTVEPRTPLGKWTARGETIPAPDDRAAGEYLAAHRRLVAAGYEHYEVSNAALPGFAARHNSAYWRRAPFIGLGPSAHSGFGDTRSWNVREWESYRARTADERPVVEEMEQLTPEQVRLEQLYLGLRTREGCPVTLLPEGIVARWMHQGWVSVSGDRATLTAEGWLRLDALVSMVSAC